MTNENVSTDPETRGDLNFVWNYVEWGGAQIYLIPIIKAAKGVFRVRCFIPKRSDPNLIKLLEDAGAGCVYLEYDLGNAAAVGAVGRLRRQARRIRSEMEILTHIRPSVRPTIFQLDIAIWQSWLLFLCAAFRGVQLFATIHNPPQSDSRYRAMLWRLRTNVLARVTKLKIIAANEEARDKAIEWFGRDRPERIYLVRAGIEPEVIHRVSDMADPPCRFLEGNNASVDIVTVGSFIERKGRRILLNALNILREKGRNVSAAWLAPDAGPSERDLVDGFDLAPSFQLISSRELRLDREASLQFFRCGKIFVLPSLVEGLPIALLEAMALGIPVVTTAVGAIPEVVRDGETGIIANVGDAADLADKISDLLDDEARREKLSAAARVLVLERFNASREAERAIAAYKLAISTDGK